MVCTGAVILTEDRIFLFGSNSNKEASVCMCMLYVSDCHGVCVCECV